MFKINETTVAMNFGELQQQLASAQADNLRLKADCSKLVIMNAFFRELIADGIKLTSDQLDDAFDKFMESYEASSS